MSTSYGPDTDIRPRHRTERPPVPVWALPKRKERSPRSVALSALVHAALIIAVVWRTSVALSEGGGWGAGPAGGGGGGGPARRFVALPAYAAPAPPADATTTETPVTPVIPMPTPEVLPMQDLARIDMPQPQVSGDGQGTSGGPGSGPGSGGGQGGGTGGGVGPGQGPGTGGDGSYILRAQPRGIILPPECAKGSRFQVRFWVAADGRVTDVEVQPPPREAGCRRDFETRMRGYRFEPAKTRDGVAVASIFPITIER